MKDINKNLTEKIHYSRRICEESGKREIPQLLRVTAGFLKDILKYINKNLPLDEGFFIEFPSGEFNSYISDLVSTAEYMEKYKWIKEKL